MKRRMKKILAFVLTFITIVSTTYTGSIEAEAAQAGENVIDSLSAEKMYDGTPLTAGASMRWVDDSHEFVYTMASSITDVGSVANTFASYDVLNSDDVSVLADYIAGLRIYKDGLGYTVDPVTIRETGTLTVTPRTGVVVTITGNSSTVPYSGAEQSVSGYTVSINDAGGLHDLYTEADFSFSGNASVTATEAGTYTMNLSADDFTNNNPNFEDVNFVIADGGVLTIEREPIDFTITTQSATKEYDGTPLTAEATAEGLATGHILQCTTTSITDAGTATNEVVSWDIVDADGNSVKDQYNEPTIIEGTLTVTPVEEMVYVVIKANNLGTFRYTGEEYVVTAQQAWSFYDASTPLYTKNDYAYIGEEIVLRATELGEYSVDEEEGAFVNINPNFINVTFAVSTFTMKITSDDVIHSGGSDAEYYAIIISDGTKMYDGTPLTVHEYWDIGLSEEGYTAKFEWDESSTITDVGSVENKVTDFKVYRGKTYSSFATKYAEVFPGTLTITPRTGVTVTITPNSATVDYDGTAHTVSGYTVSIRDAGGLHDLYTEADFTFSGNASVTATEAGTYTMNLSADDFTNNNPNFADVEFVIADGGVLTIEEPEPVTVIITGNSSTVNYSNATQSVTGYTVSIDNANYTEADFTFTGTASASGMRVGSYSMGLTASQFVNNNEAFDVTFVVNDGTLTINKLPVTVTVRGISTVKGYTGEEMTASGYRATRSNTLYALSNFSFTGNDEVKGTEIGTYYMGLDASQFENNNPNYDVTFDVTDGYLKIITNNTANVTVTVKGKTNTYVYDGQEHVMFAEYNGERSYEVLSSSAKGFDLDAIHHGCEECYLLGMDHMGLPRYVVATDVGTYELNLRPLFSLDTHYTKEPIFVVENNAYLVIEPRPVEVTITGNSSTVNYDGTEKTVSGYEVSFSDALFSEEYISFSGDATATGTNADTYAMGLTADMFTCTNANFDVTFNVIDGQLEVTPNTDEVIVTITGNGKTVSYNGTEQTADGYTVTSSNPFLTEDDIEFSGTASASGTNVGTYDMGISADDFTNTNPNFTNVTFVVVEGSDKLVIEQADEVTVTITEKSANYTYDGTEKTVNGYDVSISNDLYTEADFTFNGTASAAGTNAGTYDMDVKASDFVNNNNNFGKVTFVVEDGQLTINPSDDEIVVKVTGNGTTVTYDGTEKTADGYTVEINNPLLTEDDIAFNGDASAKGTNAGEYDMGITPEDFENLNQNFSNVTFEVVEGSDKLVIEKIDGVTVTVTENSGSFTYDGSEKNVTGYTITSISNALYTADDFKFIGDATVKGTDAGTYDMEVSTDDFVNMNANFTNVTFVVNDGQMIIGSSLEEVTVIITENSDTVTYNGTEQSVTGYTVTSISNALYTADDFTFNGTASASGTNAGTYDMEVEASDFVNNNANFSRVTFVVVDGMLTISPVTDEIVVTITGNGTTVTYTGEEQTADGYTATSSSNLYTEDDFTFSGTGSASGTDAGEYDMDIDPEDFTNNNPNFTNVTFVVAEGSDKLVIDPYAGEIIVTVTGNGTSYTYDGTEKVAEGYTVASNNTLYAADADDFEFSGTAYAKGTDADTYDMGIAAEDFVNANPNFSNIKFVVAEGSDKLVINPITEEVIVEISGNGDSYTYDGTEKIAEGYEIESSNPLFTEEDMQFDGEASASGTDAGEYDMGIAPEDFENLNKNFSNVKFVVVEGSDKLVIEPSDEEIIVTVTGNGTTHTYDGTEKTADGYTVEISNPLLSEDDIEFSGTASASGTDAGEYDMGIAAEDFANISKNFTNVTFEVVEGSDKLVIDPITDPVTVIITENSASPTYNGKEQSVEGYTVTSISNALYTENDFTFNGNAVVEGTEAGTYEMDVKAEDFENTNKNFTNVIFEVVDGQLMIGQVDEITVIITENSGSFTYDGTEKTVTGYTVSIDENAPYTEADFTFTGDATVKGTDAGTYDMEITAEDFTNNNTGVAKVNFVIVDGKLTISPITEEVIITITGNGGTYPYDRTEKTADGYTVESSNPLFKEEDLQFNGEGKASGTDAGEYDMGISPEDFENISKNFTNVTIVVEEGSDKLVIEPITDEIIVKVTGNSASYTYDGTEKTVSGYTISEITNALYTDKDFSFAGNAVAKGTEAGTYNMKFTAADFVNNNQNFTNIVFVVDTNGGRLIINEIPMYSLTIHYVDTDGNMLAADYNGRFTAGTTFTISSPEVVGYTPNYASISSSATGMPARNLEFTVVYTANPVVLEDNDSDVVTDEADTEEMERVNIGDEEVPRDDGDIPSSAIESVDVIITEDEDGNLTLVPVEDEDTALANFFGSHGDHDCNIASLIIMSVALAVVLAYSKRMKKLQAKIWAKKEELGMK